MLGFDPWTLGVEAQAFSHLTIEASWPLDMCLCSYAPLVLRICLLVSIARSPCPFVSSQKPHFGAFLFTLPLAQSFAIVAMVTDDFPSFSPSAFAAKFELDHRSDMAATAYLRDSNPLDWLVKLRSHAW